MRPPVSIIVINWNGGEVFKDCLRSLSKINYPNWELILVDNGSTDGSEREGARLIKSTKLIKNKKNVGFAKANNQAYKVSKGKYILLLNNDTKVTRDFLSKIIEKAETSPKIGVIQPKIFIMDKPGYLDNAGSFLTRIGFLEHWGFNQKDGREFDKERDIFSVKGACMLIKREVIERVGFFDPDFISYFEESDFCWRVWLAGWRVTFFPKAKIYHKIGFTIRRLDVGDMNYHYYKNRIASLIKNLGLFNLLTIIPIHVFISAGIAFVFLIRGRLSNFLMIIKSILWNFVNLSKTVRKRNFIQRRREISDRELFAKLSVSVNLSKFYGDFKRIEEDIEREQ